MDVWQTQMSNSNIFFSMVQEPKEKISSFAARLEKALDEIRAATPPEDLPESIKGGVEKQLKKQLFYGMLQPSHDSLRYLYDNPQISYTELLVAARKAESEAPSTITRTKLKAAVQKGPEPQGENLAGLDDKVTKILAAVQGNKKKSNKVSNQQ